MRQISVITSYSIHYTKLYEKDGFAVLKELRTRHRDIPVLVMTARNFEADYIEWLVRITSYIVCYTKLLRLSAVSASFFTYSVEC